MIDFVKSIFSHNKAWWLAFFIAIAAICDFLNMLPFIGVVTKQAYTFHLMVSLVVATVVTILVIKHGQINAAKLVVAISLLLFFIILYPISVWKLSACLGMMAVIILPRSEQLLAFEILLAMFCAIVLVNSLAYPLISLGVLPSFGNISPSYSGNSDRDFFYKSFGISYVYFHEGFTSNVGGLLLYRMSAWFEEPGNIGTLGALLLIATNFRMDWKGKTLLLGGCLSFSLAFFVSILCYAAMKRPKIFLYILISAVVFLFVFQDNEYIAKHILDRFVVSDEGFSGDNRTVEAFDDDFYRYSETQDVWTGHVPDEQMAKQEYFASSWKNLVWDYGIIGTSLFFIFYMLLFIQEIQGHRKRWFVRMVTLIPFVITFFINVYQRPYVLTMSYLLVFIGAMVWEEKGDGK